MCKPAFSAHTVISSFVNAEGTFGKILDVIPYCEEHRDVWSPRFATLLIDACSQLDSLWRHEIQNPAKDRDKLTMQDYKDYFGPAGPTARRLTGKYVVFWGGDEEPAILAPFSKWDTQGQSLDWWQAYNSVKHDRLVNRRRASLHHAANAFAGLFIAIMRSSLCIDAILATNWPRHSVSDYGKMLRERLESDEYPHDLPEFVQNIAMESDLFSYIVGTRLPFAIGRRTRLMAPASPRFSRWYDEFSGQVADSICT